MIFYYDKNKAIQKELYCLGIDLSPEEISNLKVAYVTYESNELFSGVPIIEGYKIRKATLIEMVDLGFIKLNDGEILNRSEGVITKINKPSEQYIWDYKLLKWIPDKNKLEDGQYIDKDKIFTVPRLKDAVSQKWDANTNTWIDTTTPLEAVQKQYFDYKPLDTPFNFLEMESKKIKQEYIDMMTELEQLIISLSASPSGFTKIVIPKPSQALIDFKNKINKIGG